MCGLSGFVDFQGKSDKEILLAMTNAISHRGPDDSGIELFTEDNISIGFGFRRLAIIDLSVTGHQPMKNPVTGDWIVFNGEIYNFLEIRKTLEEAGHSFISSSDTEVILKAYQQWGIQCVDRFIGMFAIVIYDVKNKKIVCIRDRAGVKPFFYFWKNGLFLFASELKSFHKHPRFVKSIDQDALSLFFQHGYIPAPYSIFKDTNKLLPGHILEVNFADKKLTTHKYWDVFDVYNQPRIDISFNEALLETEKLLASAFNYRMIADVPVGVFLSGGYDSSCVAGILQKSHTKKINTYTIGFEDKDYNEAGHAKAVANHLGTDHHEYYCTFNEAIDFVPGMPDVYDEPFGDQSAIPTLLVSKIARQHVTVALSADGGDELFAGYPRHLKGLSMINKLHLLPPGSSKIISILNRLIPGYHLDKINRIDKLADALKSRDEVELFGVINQSFSSSEIKSLLKNNFKKYPTIFEEGFRLNEENNTLSRILAAEYKTYLVEDILQKVDRATMSVGLEGREPFLDHRIVEFVAKLPSNYKLKDGKQKILLKELVHKIIPENIMDRPKMGFSIPMERWCRKELSGLFNDTLSSDHVKSGGIMNPLEVEKMRNSYINGKQENFQRLWLVFVFQLWFNRWMN